MYLIASGFSAARTNEATSIVLQDGKRQVPTADVSGVFLDLQRCVRLVAVNLAGAEILAAQERARVDPSARSQLLSDILAREHIDANAIDEETVNIYDNMEKVFHIQPASTLWGFSQEFEFHTFGVVRKFRR